MEGYIKKKESDWCQEKLVNFILLIFILLLVIVTDVECKLLPTTIEWSKKSSIEYPGSVATINTVAALHSCSSIVTDTGNITSAACLLGTQNTD